LANLFFLFISFLINQFYLFIKFQFILLKLILINNIEQRKLGIRDWGLGIGDW